MSPEMFGALLKHHYGRRLLCPEELPMGECWPARVAAIEAKCLAVNAGSVDQLWVGTNIARMEVGDTGGRPPARPPVLNTRHTHTHTRRQHEPFTCWPHKTALEERTRVHATTKIWQAGALAAHTYSKV